MICWTREYIKITLDYAVAAAKAFSTLSNNFKFVYVSGKSPPSHSVSVHGKLAQCVSFGTRHCQARYLEANISR